MRPDAHETAAMFDVIFERILFFSSEDLPCGAQEDKGCVSFEDLWPEPGRVGSGVNSKAVRVAQFSNGGHARGDTRVVIAIGLAKDQDFWFGKELRPWAAGRGEEQYAAGEAQQ